MRSVTDVKLLDKDGIKLIRDSRQQYAATEVIVLMACGTIAADVLAIKKWARKQGIWSGTAGGCVSAIRRRSLPRLRDRLLPESPSE